MAIVVRKAALLQQELKLNGKSNQAKEKRADQGGQRREEPVAPPSIVDSWSFVYGSIPGLCTTLSFDFVFDDEIQVLRNPWIRDWSKVLNFFQRMSGVFITQHSQIIIVPCTWWRTP